MTEHFFPVIRRFLAETENPVCLVEFLAERLIPVSYTHIGKVRKSEGVHFLCEYYGIPLEEVIAFGDGKNDMDMLKAAGNSYAMANAPREVQESAKHVTLDNDHEGLLAALRENFA